MIKKIVSNIFFASCLLISTISFAQKTSPLIIDSTVSGIVDENIKLADFLTGFPVYSAMKSTETINDTALPENFGFGKNFPAITQASLSHNTIFITGYLMARKASFGYKIILTGDSCTIKYFSVADEDIFKINKDDKPVHLISFVCPIHKLTFSKKPQFKIGELIEGMVELTTNDFWSFNSGTNTKIKTTLTGYFKTNLSKFKPGEKDAFEQIQ